MRKFFKISMLASFASLFLFTAGCQAQQETSGNAPTNAAKPAQAQGVQTIGPAEAEKMIAENANLQILDVRTPEEVAFGTIKGAKVINWFDADFASRAETTFDKALPIVVYCKAGSRSSQASEKLKERGFTNIYNLQGGMMKWESEGHPVQK
jgi:rhodanese-related sulfurtransferase